MNSLRSLLFKTVTTASAFLLTSNEWLTTFLATLFVGFNERIRSVFSGLALKLMWALDPVAMKTYEKLVSASRQPAGMSDTMAMNMELQLLEAGYKVRNHAKDIGDWTDHHSEALQAVGDALLNECGWTEAKVHTKLQEIVESIDGLEYDHD